MSRWPRIVAIFAALTLVVGVVGASSKPCDCWYGTVSDAATCTCSCDTNYLPPYCAFKSGSSVTIQVVYNASTSNSSAFVSQQAEDQLELPYSQPAGTVVYLDFDDTDNAVRRYYVSSLIALFVMPADVASSLLDDARNHASWLQQPTGAQFPILDVAVLDLVPGPLSGVAGSTLYSGSTFSITTQDIVFLVLAVAISFALCLECCCCLQNSERVVAEKQRLEAASFRAVVTPPAPGFAILVGDPLQAPPSASGSSREGYSPKSQPDVEAMPNPMTADGNGEKIAPPEHSEHSSPL